MRAIHGVAVYVHVCEDVCVSVYARCILEKCGVNCRAELKGRQSVAVAECGVLLCWDRSTVTRELRGFKGKLLYIIPQSDHRQNK